MKLFKRKKPEPQTRPHSSLFTTHIDAPRGGGMDYLRERTRFNPAAPKSADGQTYAMDSLQGVKDIFALQDTALPDNIAYWYGGQTFIGYQLCAVLAQNWLVDKACTMPARDSIRMGYEISIPSGIKIDPEKITALQEMDEKFRIPEKLVEFVRFSRIFGIRHALFEVDSPDPDYYLKPFNIDGVRPGSYRGIAQIDPYWITPELNFEAASNPANPDFYEPTWWRVNGQRIHKSHFVIIKTSEVADILKPAYLYGGISIPQKIFERVYAAERTANEAPLLALTKRTTSIKTDLTLAKANQDKFLETIGVFSYFRDNFGIKILGTDDVIEQFDTSLTDLDAAIMTQYQIVAAASEVPATKLLGTAPKGFNSTGEYEEASYHEMLESIQKHDLTAFLKRHHELCVKSEISPQNPFPVQVSWMPLDSPTALEVADLNLKKAQTAQALNSLGAIDGIDERQRITLDPDSGYANLPDIERDISEIETNEENEQEPESEEAQS